MESKILLHDDEPAAIDALIEYFYKGTYTQMQSNQGVSTENQNTARSTFDAIVFKVADKYDVPELAEMASTSFHLSASLEFDIPAFADTIIELYEDTPENELAQAMCEKVISLLTPIDDQLMTELKYADFRKMLKHVGIFSMQFPKAFSKQMLERRMCELAEITASHRTTIAKDTETENAAREQANLDHEARLTRLDEQYRHKRLEGQHAHGARLNEMTRRQVEGLCLADEITDHRAMLVAMSKAQKLEMARAQSLLDQDMGGIGERRFRCGASGCSSSFVALTGSQRLMCPYCGGLVRI